MADEEASTGTGRAIHQLDERTVQRIAAGEVVERPASVVKELVENSLDANATRVDVSASGDRATDRIEVVDDGEGIPRSMLDLAVGHHTTSKITSETDIQEGVSTLGFRGEALHAIGQVSRLTIASRPPDADGGAEITVDGGVVGEVQPAGVPTGTRVVVEGLFEPVPARRKFLDQPQTERRRVRREVERLALAHPDVALSLTIDGRQRFETPGDGDRRAALASIYGRDVAESATAFDAEDDLPTGVDAIDGLVTDPETTRTDPQVITTVVNGRPVDDGGLRRAVVAGFGDRLAPDRYPFAMVGVAIDPHRVDVNVHPRKRTIHFDDRDVLEAAVEATVADRVSASAPVPSGPPRAGGADVRTGPRPAIDLGAISTSGTQATLPGTADATDDRTYDRLPNLRILGQAHDAYVLAESADGIVLIDQHAADERIQYERLQAALRSEAQRQQLANPVSVALTPEEVDVLETTREPIEEMGFRLTVVDERTVRVNAVPAVLGSALEPDDLIEAVRLLLRGGLDRDDRDGVIAMADPMLSDLACHPAITASESLSEGTISALLSDLDACDSPWTCPHGRPTMIEVTGEELDERFERDYPGARPCRDWDAM